MDWIKKCVGFVLKILIVWYLGRYVMDKGSIVFVGDITLRVSKASRDVAIFEELEYLCWYYFGVWWMLWFKYVVGIIYINYLEYV